MRIGASLISISDYLFRLLFKVLFRYDIFISYARGDGKDYALKLRDQLRSLDFSCFLDFDELPAGNSLNRTLRNAIKRSATLVIVGTERAVKSPYVKLEVEEFTKTGRNIIPINIAGSLAAPPWSVIEQRDIVWIDENKEALDKAVPSPIVADSLDKLFKYTRRNVRVRSQVVATLIFFILGAALAYFLIQAKVNEANAATRTADESKAQAKTQKEIADAATAQAEIDKNDAAVAKAAAAVAKKDADDASAEAIRQQKIAQAMTKEAELQRRVALTRAFAANAVSTRNQKPSSLATSALLAIEAIQRSPSIDVLQNAQATLREDLKLLASPKALMKHDDTVSATVFSPKGEYLITGDEGGLVRIWTSWDTASPIPVNVIKGAGIVKTIALSRDEKYLAVATDKGEVVIWADWQTKSPRLVRKVSLPIPPRSIAFSNLFLATADGTTTARVWTGWDTKDFREVAAIPDRYGINLVAFDSTGSHLITVGIDNTVRAWEGWQGWGTGENGMREVAQLRARGDVKMISLSEDSIHLAVATATNVAVWEGWAGKEPKLLRTIESGGLVNGVAFDSDPRNLYATYMAVAASDGTVRVWKLSTGEEVARAVHGGSAESVAFSPDGRYIASGSDDETSRVWESVSRKNFNNITTDSPPGAVAFNKDGRYLITGEFKKARIIEGWNTAAPRPVSEVETGSSAKALALSPNDKYLVVADGPGTDKSQVAVRVWEGWSSQNPKQVATLAGGKKVGGIAFDSGGTYLAISNDKDSDDDENQKGNEPATEVWKDWNTATPQMIARIPSKSNIAGLAFNPMGKHLATADPDQGIRLWEGWQSKDYKQVNKSKLDQSVYAINFSPNGKFLAAATYQAVVILDAVSLKKVNRIRIGGTVEKISFSRDGKYLAVASGDVRVFENWDKRAAREVAQLPHRDEIISAVGFAPDSRYMITATGNVIRIWFLRPADLIDEACSRLTRNLSKEEWSTIMPGVPFNRTCLKSQAQN
ncbi:MAG TPA: TIR domain-containing protein [Blastocatellia bacterium]|nr:TIR domain-containing protein [Blastocatellia bacterium]